MPLGCTARSASWRGTIRHNEVDATARVNRWGEWFSGRSNAGTIVFDSETEPRLVSPRHTAFAFTFSRGKDEQRHPLLPVPSSPRGWIIYEPPFNPAVAPRALRAVEEWHCDLICFPRVAFHICAHYSFLVLFLLSCSVVRGGNLLTRSRLHDINKRISI